MSREIERKFLVIDDSYRESGTYEIYHQGYLSKDKNRIVRVRIMGSQGLLTIKGLTKGFSRDEYEYKIPIEEARSLLNNICLHPTLKKYRYRIPYKGFIWEIDEFSGENDGLIVAEIELETEDQIFEKPVWIGEEVTGDPRYYNSNLVSHPYKSW